MTKDFYTYAWVREDGRPYYIGKGKGNRCFREHRGNLLPPDKSRVIILKKNLTEEEAFRHEVYMIAVLGRKNAGKGILVNLTDGGEGPSGRVVSEEERLKHSLNTRRYFEELSPEEKEKINRKRSETFQGKSSEEKNASTEKRLKKLQSLPEETRKEFKEKEVETKRNWPEERRKDYLEKMSQSLKEVHANRTAEQKEEIARKRKETWAKKAKQATLRGKL